MISEEGGPLGSGKYSKIVEIAVGAAAVLLNVPFAASQLPASICQAFGSDEVVAAGKSVR